MSIRVTHFRLMRVSTPGAGTPVYELTVGDSTRIVLPGDAWRRIGEAVVQDVDAMASGAILTPGEASLVKG